MSRPSDVEGMSLTVAGFDPGGRTGWAWMQFRADTLLAPDASVHDAILDWDYGYYAGPEHIQVDRAVHMIHTVQQVSTLLGVISEDFILDPARMTAAREMLSPVRINAVLEDRLRGMHIELQYQLSSFVSKLTDDRLRHLGLYAPQKDARMAVKHVYEWTRNWRQHKLAERQRAAR